MMNFRGGPVSRSYFSQRLRLHYADWGNTDKPPLLLVHGARDHCRSWDWVAEQFSDDYHVIAPDLRGHGDSEWSRGSAYAMYEFVYDIAQLIHQLDLAPLTIIAHSMGGSVALRYTGLFPDTVKKIVAIEGLGPPPALVKEWQSMSVFDRSHRYIEQARGLASRQPRRYATIEDAVKRMAEENSFLSLEQAQHLTYHGVIQNEDGTFSWKFDNYMRVMSPIPFDMDEMAEIIGAITCPVLLMRGADSWASDPQKDGRINFFKQAQSVRSVCVEKAGHWVHHDQLDTFIAESKAFLAD